MLLVGQERRHSQDLFLEQQHSNNSVVLVASLAPAEANVGAVQRNVTGSLTSPFLGMLDKFHVEAYF